MARISMNMPEDLLKQVDERAKDLYISRSAFITMAVSQKIQADEMAKALPDIVKAYNEQKNKDDEKQSKEEQKFAPFPLLDTIETISAALRS